VRAHALALLLGGMSPEQVEGILEATADTRTCILDYDGRTALSDPTNVLMVEVTEDAGA
jgi:hypothetical protein